MLSPYSAHTSSYSKWGAENAWEAAVRELNSVTPEFKERQLFLHKIFSTDRKNGRDSSVSSHQELPPSIELPLPPGGEGLLPSKTLQRVERMNNRPIVRECVS